MARIFYECLDNDTPAGGVRRLYRHVEILAKAGFDASILHHSEGFRVSWFSSNAPITYWTDALTFDSTDVLVIPEGHIDLIRRSEVLGCHRVVIALNWGNIFARLKIGETWREYGISHVLSGSLYEQEVLRRSMGLDSTVIVSGIDSAMFKPGPKKPAIAFMTKKIPEALHIILTIFRAKYPEYANVPLIPLDGLSHEVVSSQLAEAALFLTHSLPEGLSRKTLEAMASGCVVVGFAGGGSREFMVHMQNCYLAPDADFLLAAEYLGTALGAYLRDEAVQMRKAARDTALLYSLEREEASVIRYWERFTLQLN